MLIKWAEFIEFLRTRVRELADTQFDQVRYGDVGLAIMLAMVVAGALVLTLYRIFFRPRGHSRHHSGHLIHEKLQRGPFVRALYHVPSWCCCWPSPRCCWRSPTRS